MSNLSEDWFVQSTQRVEQAARGACDALEAAIQHLERARQAGMTGASLLTVVEDLQARGAKDLRRRATEAFREYQRALADLRAAVVKDLVDQRGMTFTELSRVLGISRQAVSRLYYRGDDGAAPS